MHAVQCRLALETWVARFLVHSTCLLIRESLPANMDTLIKISDPALYDEDEAWLRSLRLSIVPIEDDDMMHALEQSSPIETRSVEAEPIPNLQRAPRTSVPKLADGGCQKVTRRKQLHKTEIRQLEQRAFAQLTRRHMWLLGQQEHFQGILDGRVFLPLMIRHNRYRGALHHRNM